MASNSSIVMLYCVSGIIVRVAISSDYVISNICVFTRCGAGSYSTTVRSMLRENILCEYFDMHKSRFTCQAIFVIFIT